MRAVTQSGRRSALGRNGSSAQCRLLAKSGHFGPRLLPGGTLSTRSSALPPDPKRRLPGEAAIERPTNSPTPERQAFPQAAWSHAQGVEEGTWIGLASRAWRSRPRTTLDRPHPPRASCRSPGPSIGPGMPARRGPFFPFPRSSWAVRRTLGKATSGRRSLKTRHAYSATGHWKADPWAGGFPGCSR
jgi:hypothetical protein